MLSGVNRGIFTRTSTLFVAVALGSFFFEHAVEVIAVNIFETRNKGKLWKDVKDRFGKPKETD